MQWVSEAALTEPGPRTAFKNAGYKCKLTLSLIVFPHSPYDGKWSKTMVGFGPEDEHFVAELTYNYGVGEYQLGNDFLVGQSSLTGDNKMLCSVVRKKNQYFLFVRESLCNPAKL